MSLRASDGLVKYLKTSRPGVQVEISTTREQKLPLKRGLKILVLENVLEIHAHGAQALKKE